MLGVIEFKIQRSSYYRVDNWNKKLEKLPEIIDKLRHFQITDKSVFYILDRMDREGNIIYLDPPYVLDTRSAKKRYTHECEDDFHVELCEKILSMSNAFVALSGYENEIYQDMLGSLYQSTGPHTQATVSKKSTKECLWTNYKPPTQMNLFQIDSSLKKSAHPQITSSD